VPKDQAVLKNVLRTYRKGRSSARFQPLCGPFYPLFMALRLFFCGHAKVIFIMFCENHSAALTCRHLCRKRRCRRSFGQGAKKFFQRLALAIKLRYCTTVEKKQI
jgi:hypothetical protein